jgi:hypothetical protein
MRAMRIGLAIMGLVALAAVAGCGDDETETPPGGGGGGAHLEGDLTYTRGGGIAGRADRLVVRPDGSGTLETRKGGERGVLLSKKELSEVQSELTRANLPDLPAESVADPAAPDAFAHRVVYRGTTVTADDPSMPARLRGLVAVLARVVDARDKG